MKILDFKGKAAAEQWNSDMETLNERTEAILKDVYYCLDEIKSESTGSFVDELLITATDMADAAAEMIKAMKSIKDLVGNIIKTFANFVGQATQSVLDSRIKATDL